MDRHSTSRKFENVVESSSYYSRKPNGSGILEDSESIFNGGLKDRRPFEACK